MNYLSAKGNSMKSLSGCSIEMLMCDTMLAPYFGAGLKMGSLSARCNTCLATTYLRYRAAWRQALLAPAVDYLVFDDDWLEANQT